MQKLERMKELSAILSEAAKAYYQESREIMSNFEYDKLYDELTALEEETGTIFAGSPTQKVGYEVLSELPKERHERPMLSLNKTKSVDDLREWLGSQKGLLSWKMDGLTVVLTYEDGKLAKAVTRGNGEIGEVITGNARTFVNLPMSIPYKGRLILRGEAIITYEDFEKLNATIADENAKYKNPRNLCSGSVRQLNSEITAGRNVRFMGFALVQAEGVEFQNSKKEQANWLSGLGFEMVESVEVTAESIADAIAEFAKKVEDYNIPSDGLVLLYDDIEYGASLGRTAKFPRDSIAFKWADELQETTLSYIEWSASRTGLINPVAVFEPVELEGTTVSRASVHNISIMEGLELGAGDRITVYKANMIIPQIADNRTRSGVRDIPEHCPVCGGATEIRSINEVKSLYCTNPDCQAKKMKGFALFVSRDALNIDGLSEMTLEKFIAAGFIHEFSDIFHLDRHKEAIVEMEGFGEKSYENLVQAAKHASHTTLPRLIYGLGIAGIGL
ncbi:MAG: NAD-dependent DNA ligase LigA, partial [Lachnospiraceae bacterium]|nr:NAD-dependent DNA ligase LigA [Lachnospiraceae bacterium]